MADDIEDEDKTKNIRTPNGELLSESQFDMQGPEDEKKSTMKLLKLFGFALGAIVVVALAILFVLDAGPFRKPVTEPTVKVNSAAIAEATSQPAVALPPPTEKPAEPPAVVKPAAADDDDKDTGKKGKKGKKSKNGKKKKKK